MNQPPPQWGYGGVGGNYASPADNSGQTSADPYAYYAAATQQQPYAVFPGAPQYPPLSSSGVLGSSASAPAPVYTAPQGIADGPSASLPPVHEGQFHFMPPAVSPGHVGETVEHTFAEMPSGPQGLVGIEQDDVEAVDAFSVPACVGGAAGAVRPHSHDGDCRTWGTPPSAQHPPQLAPAPPLPSVDDDYVIPHDAPLAIVPTDLPLEQVVLLDLVAQSVVQGGPTVEEELVARETPSKYNEEGNPAFSFLHAPLSDPRMRYYRWRLYSLLQGDSLLQWRTAPFQIERGSRAYVWVPPPPLLVGPACLRTLWGPPAGAADAAKTSSAVRTPSAWWLARLCAEQRIVFAVMTADEEARWRALLDPTPLLRASTPPASTAAADSEVPPESSVTPSPGNSRAPAQQCDSRQGRKRQRVVDVAGDAEASSSSSALFQSDVIAERMLFVVDHMHVAYHVLSLLLDAVVDVAHRAVSATDDADRFLCTQLCLWYLFVLHDVIHNAGRVSPISEAELAARYARETGASTTASVLGDEAGQGTPPTPSSLSPSLEAGGVATKRLRCAHPSGVPFLVGAVEMILPTVLEACAVVVSASFDQSLRVTPSAPPSNVLVTDHAGPVAGDGGGSGGGGAQPRVPWWAVEGHIALPDQSSGVWTPQSRAREGGVLLLGWLHTVFPTWFGYRRGQRRATVQIRHGGPTSSPHSPPPSSPSTTLPERPHAGTLAEGGRDAGPAFSSSPLGEGHEEAGDDLAEGGGRREPLAIDTMLGGALRLRLKAILSDTYTFLVSPETLSGRVSATLPTT